MAAVITPVSAIVGGRINFKLKVRLIHMWSVPGYHKPAEDQYIIDHVVEKDPIKENAKNGRKMKLIDMTLEDPEIADKEVQLSQGVSLTAGSQPLPLADDMLTTKMMTIEDLIESSEECYAVVLARICEIESNRNWYYEACTKCKTSISVIAGKLYYEKCAKTRTAVPRIKLPVQVMDATDSTTFVLFDRNVTQYVGRTVQDLIESNSQVTNDEEEAAYNEVVINLADNGLTGLPLLEQGDSTKTDVVEKEGDATPMSKPTGKRSSGRQCRICCNCEC
ncbi:hypothetical protein TSUD_287430 [Trifolium subterraneum]|uniref:Replication factor A C-terminal domain-containing protein n=1 Tax=Trifolium subterraneum TaxID=3900 RepID=A0A2Z6PBC7_TRISU|nr:hypothetical protein TSUD_287430 [Trifolium subterraneum]